MLEEAVGIERVGTFRAFQTLVCKSLNTFFSVVVRIAQPNRMHSLSSPYRSLLHTVNAHSLPPSSLLHFVRVVLLAHSRHFKITMRHSTSHENEYTKMYSLIQNHIVSWERVNALHLASILTNKDVSDRVK